MANILQVAYYRGPLVTRARILESRGHQPVFLSLADRRLHNATPRKKWMAPPATVSVVSPAPCKDFMNLKEAAAYFGVSVWSIRGLIAKGFIGAKRMRKYDIVRREELSEYWERAV